MTTSPRSDLIAAPLVGRAREQAILRNHLDAALGDHGSLVLVGGEAGIGKTALAEQLCHEAVERGALLLIGRCYDLTETPPYGPWIEIFGRYHAEEGFPALPTVFAQRGTVGEATSQSALFQQIHDFLGVLLTKGPLVLLLDDLHWADPASLNLLRVVARHLTDLPLLILVTYRSDEIAQDDFFAQLLPALVREAHARRLDLRRLGTDDVQALVLARYDLPDADRVRLVTHLHDRASGNPFFTGELLHTLEEERLLREHEGRWAVGDLTQAHVPLLIRQVIGRRLARLDADARRMLAIAAVIGHEIPLPLWSTVAETDNDALLPTIERAVAAHLLEETPDRTAMRFVHALIRETLYDSTPLPTRRAWHQQVAEALISYANPDSDAITNHFQRAGDTRAAEWLVRAGDRAQHAYAYLTAAQRYEAALAVMRSDDGNSAERGWHLVRIARMRRYSDPRRGLTYLDEAAHIAKAIGDRVLAVIVMHDRATNLLLIGDHIHGLPELRAGVAALEALTPREQAQIRGHRHVPDYALGTQGNLMMNLAWAGHFTEVLNQESQFVLQARAPRAELTPGPSLYGDGFFGLGITHAMQGRSAAAQKAFAYARARYSEDQHMLQVGMATLYETLVVSLTYRVDRIESRRRLAEEGGKAWSQAIGVIAEFSPLFGALPLMILEGDWDGAYVVARDALTTKMAVSHHLTVSILGPLARYRGEPELAWAQIRALLPDGPTISPDTLPFYPSLVLQRLAAALAMDSGDLVLAQQWLTTHDTFMQWGGAVLGQADGHLGWAAYYRATGDTDPAVEQATIALACAADPRQPLALIAAHRALGELATDRRCFNGAEEHFQSSLSLADACAAPYERAQTLMAMAEFAHARGANTPAHTFLSEVRAICTPLDAKPLLARADALTRKIGADPSPAPRYPGGLTAREVEVLRLAAQGLSNDDIAAHLFLSVHTVHRHMANILTKLDLPSRVAAVAYAMRYGIL